MKDDLVLAEVDGEGMLIDVEKGISFFLNETGLLIYKLLKEGKNEQAIKACIIDEYDTDEKEVERDIKEFVNLLHQKSIS